MKKYEKPASFGIIGLDRFGLALAEELARANKEIIAVDEDENSVKEARRLTDYAFVAKNIEQAMLEEVGIQNCDAVVVCMSEEIDKSILTTMMVSNMNVPHIISIAGSKVHGDVLKRLGAVVIHPEQDMAMRLGKKMVYDNFLDSITLDGNVEVRRIQVTDKLIGVSVKDANTRGQYKLNIIAIEHDHHTDVDFSAQYCFSKDDIISVIGKIENIDRFESDIHGE